MIVRLGNEWIDVDLIVAHAPHSWETKHHEGAEELTDAFWELLLGSCCREAVLGELL